MILYWPSWKGAALAYAHALGLKVPRGFNADTNTCGAQAEELFKTIQRRVGLPPDGVVGPQTRAVLRRWVAPIDMHLGMEHFGHKGARDQLSIHYGEVRPILHEYALPMTTDCSGWDTLCCELSGAPDPNGFHFNGVGNTSTMLANASPVSRDMLSPGCHVIFSNPDHAAFVVEIGPDPLLSSHGNEDGPYLIPLSVEARYHQSIAGFRALRRL